METQTKTVRNPEIEPKPVNAYFVLDSSNHFKALIKLLSEFFCEATFQIDEAGLNLIGMDPSRVAMVIMNLPKEGCDEYRCTEPGKFCIDLEYLLKTVLKKVNKDESVKLELKDNKPLAITLKGKLMREFTQPLLEIPEDYDIPPTPKVVHKARVKLVLSSLKQLFEDLTDHFRITVNPDNVVFSQEGDIGNFKCAIKKGDDALLDVELLSDKPVTSVYSSSYLEPFIKSAAPLAEVLTVALNTDMPIQLKIEQPFGYSTVSLWTAPRIECE